MDLIRTDFENREVEGQKKRLYDRKKVWVDFEEVDLEAWLFPYFLSFLFL
jgi:hypothetical protein